MQVMPAEERAIVRGINMVKRHQRQNQMQESGIVNKEARSTCPIWLWLIRKTTSQLALVSLSRTANKVRVAKRSGDVIDG